MKKKDCILIIVIFVIAGSAYLGNKALTKEGNEYVRVSVDGKEFGIYDLNVDQKISINHTNILEIKDHKATMIEATCPDKLCVHQKAIEADRESIICLPNKIIVEVQSKEESQLDAVTN
ncbi:NusG domain II-containing protein [Lachnospiraceae bacterium LCP25S3_G4]